MRAKALGHCDAVFFYTEEKYKGRAVIVEYFGMAKLNGAI
jgi:hypothetical protein